MKKYCYLLMMFCSLRTNAQWSAGVLQTRHAYCEIPLTETLHEIHTKATLRGDEYDFMIDSGAPAFISSDIQKKYHFKVLFSGKVQDATGNLVKTELVLIDTIRFGPFTFTGIPTLVLDMKESPIECLRLPGNIGSNMLRFLYLQFDLQAGHMACTDDRALLKHSLPHALPAQLSTQYDIYMPVMLNGNFKDTVHFDSGDGYYYRMSGPRMDQFVSAFPAEVVREGFGTVSMGVGGGGELTKQYKTKPKSISLSGADMPCGIIAIAENDRSRMGRDILQYGILQLNYPDSTYAFERYTNPHIEREGDYGYQSTLDGDEAAVGCVWKGTAAETAGMQAGDHLLQIDDMDLSQMDKCQITDNLRSMLRNQKSLIIVTFRHRKQKPKTVTLPRTFLD
jgi:hypothetical protein